MLANLIVALIVIAAGAHFYLRYLKPGKASGCGTGGSSGSACNSCQACDTSSQMQTPPSGGARVIKIHSK